MKTIPKELITIERKLHELEGGESAYVTTFEMDSDGVVWIFKQATVHTQRTKRQCIKVTRGKNGSGWSCAIPKRLFPRKPVPAPGGETMWFKMDDIELVVY